jgi:hypothetical protein
MCVSLVILQVKFLLVIANLWALANGEHETVHGFNACCIGTGTVTRGCRALHRRTLLTV